MSFRLDWFTFVTAACLLAGMLWVIYVQKSWLTALRILVYGLLAWLILEPATTMKPTSSQKPAIAVLVDVSRSMSIADPVERLTQVKKILQKVRKELEDQFDVSYYQFAQQSVSVSFKELLNLKPYGIQTDIFESLRQVSLEKKQQRPAVLLFSDGTQQSPSPPVVPLKAGLPPPSPLPPEAISRSADKGEGEFDLDLPVYAVGIGQGENLKDIAIREIRGSDFAFKNRPVEIIVHLKNAGYAGKTVPLILTEEREKQSVEIDVKEITFTSSASDLEVTFRFIPSTVGSLLYRIAVPPQSGEITKQNNAMNFRLDVGREKMRILYLCGQPGPEYAFLRHLLKSDPAIELVSFVILRNPENIVPVPEEQLSLIPFPAQDIFVRTLNEFDLLIFENFSYSRLGISASHLENIQRFVEDRGGSFLMIGGENSFGKGGYQHTAIEKIVPVTMNADSESVEWDETAIRVLEPQHPIMNVGQTLAETEQLWKNTPRLNGYYRFIGTKPGAALLASAMNGQPLIVSWQRGKGRVTAMGTLSTWQWALESGERTLYPRFWSQMIRWLIGSGETQDLRIIFNESEFFAGKRMIIKLLIPQHKLKGSGIQVHVVVSQGDKTVETLPVTLVSQSEYRSEWIPNMEGTYKISAEVTDGMRRYETHRMIEVKTSDMELANPYPNHHLLKDLAQKTGGEYFEAKDFTPDLLAGKIKAVQTASVEPVQKNLWTSPWLFYTLAGLLLMEWGIRRYRGEL